LIIIAIIALNLSGCGYKKSPYYEEKVDDNVQINVQPHQKNEK
jgi:hypothetical protein